MPGLAFPSALSCIPCFGSLAADETEWLQSAFREQSYEKGEIVFVEGEPCPGLFVVKTGSVKLYRTSPEGEEHYVGMIRQAGCFECAPLFDKGSNPVSAVALAPSTLYFLPASIFHSLIKSHPQIVLGIVPVLAMRLRSLIGMVEDLSFRPAYSRLANLLLQLAERYGEVMVVWPSQGLNQQHLACMLGCSRQVVNVSLRKMVKAGIIKMEARRIVVLQPDALRHIAGVP